MWKYKYKDREIKEWLSKNTQPEEKLTELSNMELQNKMDYKQWKKISRDIQTMRENEFSNARGRPKEDEYHDKEMEEASSKLSDTELNGSSLAGTITRTRNTPSEKGKLPLQAARGNRGGMSSLDEGVGWKGNLP